ncbi:MAG: hypothetical protein EBR30_16195 [Cytophagia bacterium]|nr:hypothetical protein [Cytophagia bacterium]NBW36524.1 hypothetical protein [Cytophagia bacterium]
MAQALGLFKILLLALYRDEEGKDIAVCADLLSFVKNIKNDFVTQTLRMFQFLITMDQHLNINQLKDYKMVYICLSRFSTMMSLLLQLKFFY